MEASSFLAVAGPEADSEVLLVAAGRLAEAAAGPEAEDLLVAAEPAVDGKM